MTLRPPAPAHSFEPGPPRRTARTQPGMAMEHDAAADRRVVEGGERSTRGRGPRPEGRWLAFAMVGAYFALLAHGAARTSLADSWASLGVPVKEAAAGPVLASDLYFVLATAECDRRGEDVYVRNPCDPWERRMNYPRVWIWLARAGPWGADDAALVGAAIGALFFASVFLLLGRLSLVEGLVVGALLVSRSVMLGVERGNVDLLMFALVALAILLIETRGYATVAYGTIFLAGVLKYFPVAALACLARERRPYALRLGGLLGAAFTLYLAVTWADLRLIRHSIPFFLYRSFGGPVLFEIAAGHLRERGHDATSYWATGLYAAAILVALVLAAVAAHRAPFDGSASRLDGFRAGAAIYVLTYVLYTNFDYKQIFLLLLLPQLFEWAHRGGGEGVRAVAALGACCITFWFSDWGHLFVGAELVNFALFLYCAFELWRTRPPWCWRAVATSRAA